LACAVGHDDANCDFDGGDQHLGARYVEAARFEPRQTTASGKGAGRPSSPPWYPDDHQDQRGRKVSDEGNNLEPHCPYHECLSCTDDARARRPRANRARSNPACTGHNRPSLRGYDRGGADHEDEPT
jgi:hypothetical protein